MLVALFLVFTGASLTAAEDYIQPDGRLNQVTHFGGDAFYCVDRDFEPTQQYSDFDEGGFRLLNIKGQELWFVPALQVSAAVAEAKETGNGVLVGEGQGTYGPVSVYTYVTNENDDYFIFSGYDEFGKPNSITFKFCIPVGPIPEPPGEGDTEECAIIYVPRKVLASVASAGNDVRVPIGCEDCPDTRNDQKKLYRKEISQIPLDDCLIG